MDRRREEVPKRPLVYNHFEQISILSTKTGLLRTLREYYSTNKEATEAKYGVQDTLPMAFIITSNPCDQEFQDFKKKFKQIDRGYFLNERMPSKHMQQNYWLLKPSNMNQGKGIEIFHSLKQIGHYLANKSHDLQWIVQKYIERPLLYKKRKFDIRVLALATNEMELYYYNIGYMRTSSDEYNLDSKSKFIHLTNNCYQKFSQNYEKFEEGNQLSFEQFQQYLDESNPDLKVSFNEHILPRIKDLVIDCFVAGISGLNPNKREHCFELMGFDFLIDEDFRVWLIEVNTNPYFGVVNNQLPRFIDNLVDDTFKLTLDKVFKPDPEVPLRKESEYELLYSQQQNVNKRRQFSEQLYPVPQIKEQLDREREQQILQRHHGNMPNATKPSGLTSNIRSAAPPLPKQGQNGMRGGFNTLNEGSNQHKKEEEKLINTESQKLVEDGEETSNRSKSVLTPGGERTQTKQLQNAKFKNSITENKETKHHHRRRKVNKHTNENFSNAQSINRIYNRDQSQTLMNGGGLSHSSMKQRRGATPTLQKEKIEMEECSAGEFHTPNNPNATNYETNLTQPQLNSGSLLNGRLSPVRGGVVGLTKNSANNTNNLHGNSLSILLRKKAEDTIRVTQQNQAEYINKIQRILKQKNLIEMVKDALVQGENFDLKRKEFSKIFGQIIATFSNPEAHSKKDVTTAMTALKMMIYSQFIIHFNDKSVLTKLIDILKLQGTCYLEVKEVIIKTLTDISKHYSIRNSLLNRKLLSKLMKSMNDHLNMILRKYNKTISDSTSTHKSIHANITSPEKNKEEVILPSTDEVPIVQNQQDDCANEPQVKVLQAYAVLVISLASLSNTKFYIPGETKEVESLRKKAITNCLLIFVQALSQQIIQFQNAITDQVKEVQQKLQQEILEAVDVGDYRLHVYTVFSILKNKVAKDETNPADYRIELLQEIEGLSNDRLFQQLRSTIEAHSQSKSIKIKSPAFIETLEGTFLNASYLRATFQKFRKMLEININSQSYQEQLQKKKRLKHMIKQGSQIRLPGAKALDVQIDQYSQYNIQRQLHFQGNQRFGAFHNKSNARPAVALIFDSQKGTKQHINGMTPNSMQGNECLHYDSSDIQMMLQRQQQNDSPLMKDEEMNKRVSAPTMTSDDKQLNLLAARNLIHINSNNFIRNDPISFALNEPTQTTNGRSATMTSDQKQMNNLILPNLDQQQPHKCKDLNQHPNFAAQVSTHYMSSQGLVNQSYLMKLQPYLQSSKITNRAPKRIPNHKLLNAQNLLQSTSTNTVIILHGLQPPKAKKIESQLIPLGKTNQKVGNGDLIKDSGKKSIYNGLKGFDYAKSNDILDDPYAQAIQEAVGINGQNKKNLLKLSPSQQPSVYTTAKLSSNDHQEKLNKESVILEPMEKSDKSENQVSQAAAATILDHIA